MKQAVLVEPPTPILNCVLLTTVNNIVEIQVNFTSVANAASYTAYFTPDVVSATLLPQHIIGTTGPLTIVQSALQSGELYHVTVSASNSAGESLRSTAMSITVNNTGGTSSSISSIQTELIGAGVAILIVVGLVLFLLYRKQKIAPQQT